MENVNNDLFPIEVQNFIKRLNFFECGSKYSNELYDFEYIPTVLKIKYLCSIPNYRDIIVPYLKYTALPIINNAYDIIDAICMGINLKGERLTQEEKNSSLGEYYKLQNLKHDLHYKDFEKFVLLDKEESSYCRDRLENEFQYYFQHLEPIAEGYVSINPSEIKDEKSNKIQTNLSIDELAVLFKILNEFDDTSKGQKKIIKDVEYKRDLHKAVVATFSSVEEANVKLKTYENRYNTNDQFDAVEFWVNKFRALAVATALLNDKLLAAKDKSVKNKKK